MRTLWFLQPSGSDEEADRDPATTSSPKAKVGHDPTIGGLARVATRARPFLSGTIPFLPIRANTRVGKGR
jgi:hypothetical protein